MSASLKRIEEFESEFIKYRRARKVPPMTWDEWNRFDRTPEGKAHSEEYAALSEEFWRGVLERAFPATPDDGERTHEAENEQLRKALEQATQETWVGTVSDKPEYTDHSQARALQGKEVVLSHAYSCYQIVGTVEELPELAAYLREKGKVKDGS